MKNLLLICFISLILVSACTKITAEQTSEIPGTEISKWNKNLTDVIVEDLFTPPVAGRIYAYCNIAAYEALVPSDPQYRSLSGQLIGLSEMPLPGNDKIDHNISSFVAFNTVANKMIYSQHRIMDYQKNWLDSISKTGIKDKVYRSSIEYGKEVGNAVLAWASRDNFYETRKMTRYSLSDTAGAWKPTPLDFMPAVEPYWGTVRAFSIDDLNTIKVAEPIAYSTDPASDFRKQIMEVYDVSKNLDDEKKEIASYWDDNPNVSTYSGHLMYFAQKMTPGGHWIAITSLVVRDKHLSLIEAAETFSLVSIAISDAFKCCWKEKYRCNTIRPITVIQEQIDPEWESYLQTPPFPEYPSGHSSVSAAAAEILAMKFGNDFAFTDSSEVEYGLPVRSFETFREAANEAKESRLYGGIHIRYANDQGAELGKKVAKVIIDRIKTTKSKTNEPA